MKSIAIIGLGNRGTGYLIALRLFCKKDAKLVAICDKNSTRVKEAKKRNKIKDEYCFENENDFWNAGKLADVIFICTQDLDHYQHALKAIELGYDILCEKPLSPSVSECEDLAKKAKEKGIIMVVCHVLRYTKYYSKLKEILNSRIIGDVVHINHTENIGFYHYAHSYVRGNWRDSEKSSPIVMAKTCHDLDLIHWFMNGNCQQISSFGSLNYFKKENAPDGSSERCLDCKVKNHCPYDAEGFYITAPLHKATFLKFMGSTITGKEKSKKKDKYNALREGNYGRCVFRCDNNVADHQTVNIDFDNNRTATLTINAFSKKMFRQSHFMGTLGEIRSNDKSGRIVVRLFNGKTYKYKTKLIPITGHIEGDFNLIKDFVALINGKEPAQKDISFVDITVISHKMAMAAEESRINGGKVIKL